MANTRLDIIVTVRNAADKELQNVRNSIKSLGNQAQVTSSILSSLAKSLIAIGAAYRTFSFIKESISIFAEFDDVIRQAAAVTKATREEFDLLAETAKRMGATTRYTARDAAEALRFLGMAGFNAVQASKALPDVLNLAAAGSLDLGTAADITTNILSAFGLEVENLGRVNDVLVKTFTSSNTTLLEIGESFKYVGPIAKGVGSNFEDLLAAIGNLGDAGIKGSLAGTALKGAIGALFNPTRDEARLMAELSKRIGGTGLQIKDTEGNFVGFVSIIQQLEKAGFRGEEALRLFGLRAGPGIAALLNIGSESLKKLDEGLKDTNDDASRIAKEMEAGLGGAMRAFKSALEAVRIEATSYFGPALIGIFTDIKGLFIDMKDKAKELATDGSMTVYADAIKTSWEGVKTTLAGVNAIVKEMAKSFAITAAIINGETSVAKEGIKDLGSDIEKFYKKYNVLGFNLSKFQQASYQKDIELIERQIKQKEKLIEQDKESINGWRAKITGAKIYEEQLKKHSQELNALQVKLKLLQTEQKLDLRFGDQKGEGALSDAALKQIDEELAKVFSDTGPIGKGGKEGGKTLAEKINEGLIQNLLKTNVRANFIRLAAELDRQSEVLKGQYDQKKIDLEKYYDERASIIRQRATAEIKVLQEAADKIQISDKSTEQEIEKRAIADATIEAKRIALNQKLIALENEKNREIEKISEREIKEQEKIEKEKIRLAEKYNQIKLSVEKIFQDQKRRIEEAERGKTIQDIFDKELSNLDRRHEEELRKLKDFQKKELDLLTQHEKDKAVVKGTQDEQIAEVEELQRLQRREKDDLEADQYRRLQEKRLKIAQEFAAQASDTFGALYEASGKQIKEFFYLQKAAAISEAIINANLAATNALATAGNPYLGMAMAGLIYAFAIAKVATIASQSLAEGGIIEGRSPGPKSDDKVVRVTSGEYVQPVASTRYYGRDAMEALRTRSISRERLRTALNLNPRNFSMPPVQYGLNRFQSGGEVSAAQNAGELRAASGERTTNIVNVLDPAVFEQWSMSTPGQRNILNALSQNIFEVRQMVFNNQ